MCYELVETTRAGYSWPITSMIGEQGLYPIAHVKLWARRSEGHAVAFMDTVPWICRAWLLNWVDVDSMGNTSVPG